MIVDSGSFNTGTGTGDLAEQTPALGGATPQLILFMAASGDRNWGFGAASGTAARACYSTFIDDAATTTDTGHIMHSVACYSRMASTSAVDGLVDLASVGANSFVPTIDDAFAVSMTVYWVAFAGLTAAEVGTFQLTTGADQTVGTSDWDAVIFFGRGTSIGTAAAQTFVPMIGFATATKSRALCCSSQDNVADTNTFGIISDNYSWVSTNATNGNIAEGILVNSLTGGIGLTRVAGTTQYNIAYAAIKGVTADIVDSAHRTDTNNQTSPSVTFTPKFLFNISRPPVTASEEGTASTHMEGGLGWAISTSKRYANWYAEADALAAHDPKAAESTTRCSIDFLRTDGTTDEGDMDFVSFNAGTVTLDQDTAAAQATYLPMLLLGDAGDVATNQTSTTLRRTTRRRR